MTDRTIQCVQDIIAIADAADVDAERHMQTRIDEYLSDLKQWGKENPGQDTEWYLNRLDEKMTTASSQIGAGISMAASDLLEKGIDYLDQQRNAGR